MKILKHILKNVILISIFGATYAGIEIVWRGYTSPWMVLVGGVASFCVGLINQYVPWEEPMWKQMILGSYIITTIEFLSGCVLNLSWGLNIWDYSNLPFNIYGQVCLPFCIIWFLLSGLAIVVDDYLRYWFFHEEKPHYVWK